MMLGIYSGTSLIKTRLGIYSGIGLVKMRLGIYSGNSFLRMRLCMYSGTGTSLGISFKQNSFNLLYFEGRRIMYNACSFGVKNQLLIIGFCLSPISIFFSNMTSPLHIRLSEREMSMRGPNYNARRQLQCEGPTTEKTKY